MKLPQSYYNPLSIIGSVIAGVNLLIIFFFLIASIFFNVGGSYLGIYIYMILPVFLIGGLIMIPVGIYRRSKRIKSSGSGDLPRGLRLDLSDPKQYNSFIIFLIVTFVFILFTGIGSYQVYHYTESVEFCGTLCHQVMEPEYVAYQESSHSRVACVECHVGDGADWYVKSKLSGLYQVYSVLFNKYPRPIETPVHSLRPARETCEKCHWPEKFYSYSLRNEKHFLADSANTEWNIQLNMKVGPAHSFQGLAEGIHWHINKDVKIEYISTSSKLETIPWVRYTNRSGGDTLIYEDLNEKLDQEAIDTMIIREMDCMDCHNRPSHHYFPPQEFTDKLIASGDISSTLPDIKMLAMDIFNKTYPDRDTAEMMIAGAVSEYYASTYPQIADEKAELINSAILSLIGGYNENYFPYMKANWDVYPNHVGHIEFNGCFRCHNGNHISENGDEISRDCNLCHTIVGQGNAENYSSVAIDSSLEFIHPVDIDGLWKEFTCAECHRYLY